MSLTSSTRTENTCVLEIAVPAEQFKAAVDKAYKKNAPKITVPGFRKGKAPRGMIEKMYGEGVFYEDAINEVYPEAYSAAVDEAGIDPVDRADIEVLEVGKEGFTFKATVTVKPEVSVSDYKGIAAEKVITTATDEEVDAELKRLQERNGRIITVEGRAAQEGDNAIIDFEGFLEGVPFEGGKGEQYSLTLGSGQFIPGFEEQVVGKNIGDSFDVNVTFPEDYNAEELAGKAVVFKVTLHELKTRELPDLDDEFAKDISEFDTLDEYKADLKANLQERHDQQSSDTLENTLMDAVITKLEANIPQVMIENRIDDMVRDFEYRLQSQGLNLQTYLQYTGMELESFRKTFAEQGERQVKVRLALEKIAELEALAVSEEDLETEYTRLAGLYNIEADKVKGFLPASELTKDLLANKAIDVVRDSAVITEKAAEKAEETEKTEK